MAWTTPKTWSSEPLTSSDLNTNVKDNLNHLRDRLENGDSHQITSSYSTTSTSFVDVDGTNLSLTITTHGGSVLVGFFAPIYTSSGNREACLDLDVDGTRFGGTKGVASTRFAGASSAEPDLIGFVIRVDGLTAGSHTFKLQWRLTASATITIDGTNSEAQFWVQEI